MLDIVCVRQRPSSEQASCLSGLWTSLKCFHLAKSAQRSWRVAHHSPSNTSTVCSRLAPQRRTQSREKQRDARDLGSRSSRAPSVCVPLFAVCVDHLFEVDLRSSSSVVFPHSFINRLVFCFFFFCFEARATVVNLWLCFRARKCFSNSRGFVCVDEELFLFDV